MPIHRSFNSVKIINRSSVSVLSLIGALSSVLTSAAETEDPFLQLSLDELSEVMVHVQKREEPLNHVPVSATVLNSEKINTHNIQDVSGLERLTPGLRYGESGADARLAIRGTRTNDIRIGSQQVVGLFLDEAYIPSTTQSLFQWLDVEQVEVLRGPQGTLFGRNTFGGAINIRSNLPQPFESGYSRVSVGDYSWTRFETVQNRPLADNTLARFAALYEKRDGLVENLTDPSHRDDLKDEDQWMFRLSTSIRFNERFSTLLRLSHWKQSINGNGDFGYQVLGTVIDPNSGEFVPGNPREGTFGHRVDLGPYQIYRNDEYSEDIEHTHLDVTSDIEMGSYSIKSITALNDFSIDLWVDCDSSDRPYIRCGTPSASRDIIQEVRFVSNDQVSSLKWMAGLYFAFRHLNCTPSGVTYLY